MQISFAKRYFFICFGLGLIGAAIDSATKITCLFQCVGVFIGFSLLIQNLLTSIKNKEIEFKLNFQNCFSVLLLTIPVTFFSGAPYIGVKSLKEASDTRSTVGFFLALAIGIGLIYLFWRTSKITKSSNN
jgi:hypothetical protein